MITTEKDPKTRKSYELASGIVTAVYVNEIAPEQIRTYGDKGWTPTKRYVIVIDGQKIQLGMGEKDELGVKDIDGKFHTLSKGMEVSVPVEEQPEYQGKKQYRGTPSELVVLDISGAQQEAKASAGGASYRAKDMSGIHVGHSINGAMNLLNDDIESYDNLIETAKLVHNVTELVKADYTKKNPSLSEYDLGAAAGNAVLNACKMASDISEVEEIALDILRDVVPAVLAHVKSTGKPAAKAPAKAKAKAPAKAAAKPAKPAKATKPKDDEPPAYHDDVPDADDVPADFDDMDDDIPF